MTRDKTIPLNRETIALLMTVTSPLGTAMTYVDGDERSHDQARGGAVTASSLRSREDAPTCSFLGPTARTQWFASGDQYSNWRLVTWRVRVLVSSAFKCTRSNATSARTANCAEFPWGFSGASK